MMMRHCLRVLGFAVFGLLVGGCSQENLIVAGDSDSVVPEEAVTAPSSSLVSTEADPDVLTDEEPETTTTSVPSVEEPAVTTTVVSVLEPQPAQGAETLVPLSTELLTAALPLLSDPPPDHADIVEHYPWDLHCSMGELYELNHESVSAVFWDERSEMKTIFAFVHVWLPDAGSLEEAIARLEDECFIPEARSEEQVIRDVVWGMSGGFKLARYDASAEEPHSVQYRYDSDVLSLVVSHGPQTAERDLLASDWLRVSVERLDWMRAGGFVPSDTADD